MKKSAFISDILFTFGACALFTLCLFRFLRVPLIPALLLAVLCGLLFACAIGAWLKSKRNALLLKRSEEREKEKLLTHLALLSDGQKTEFFRLALTENEVALKQVCRLCLADNERICFLLFRFCEVTADDISLIFRRKTAKTKLLFCNGITKEAQTLCNTFHIEVVTGERVYALLKKRNALPSEYLGAPTANRRTEIWKICFSKRNAKRFLACGGLLLFTAFFSPFPYYYFLTAGGLLLTALLLRVFGNA